MRFVPLTKHQFAIVDDADAETVLSSEWQALPASLGSRFYAVRRRIGGRHVMMHRLLLDAPRHLLVDHINGYGLDNRRCNLRLCPIALNAANAVLPSHNTSGFKGVARSRRARWRAYISLHDTYLNLGSYGTAREAALAYDKKARELFGEFARTNADLGLL